MHVLVTGAAGFIGRHLVIELLRRPSVVEVTALDDESFGDLTCFDGYPVRARRTSILDRDQVDDAVAVADVIVHLATRWADGAGVADPLGVHDVNTTGSVRLIEAARRSGNIPIVLAASDVPTAARDAVDASVVAVQGAVEAARRSFGQPIAEIVLPDVIGRHRPWGHPRAGWVDRTIREATEQDAVDLAAGSTVQPVVTVAAAARHLADAAFRGDDGIVRVPGHPLSQMEIVAHVSRVTGQVIEIRHPVGSGSIGQHDRWVSTPAPLELQTVVDEMIRDAIEQPVR